MFAVIQCENQRRGPAKLFVRRRYYFSMVSEKNVRFMVLTLNDREGIDWRRVRSILGRTAENTLVPSDITVPADAGICPPDRRKYQLLLLRRAAEQLLKNRPAEQRQVLLADEAGQYPDFARAILEQGGRMTVYTANPEAYAAFEEQLALMPVGEAISKGDAAFCSASVSEGRAQKAAFTVAPELSAEMAVLLPPEVPVLTAFPEKGIRFPGTLLTGFAAPLPKELAACLPKKIDPADFLAALYSSDALPAGLLPQSCDVIINGQQAEPAPNSHTAYCLL